MVPWICQNKQPNEMENLLVNLWVEKVKADRKKVKQNQWWLYLRPDTSDEV